MGRIIGLLFIAALIYYLVNGIRYLIAKKILKNNITNLIKILKKIKITLSPKGALQAIAGMSLVKHATILPARNRLLKLISPDNRILQHNSNSRILSISYKNDAF